MKWNLKWRLTRANLKKKKQKETTFVGMLFMHLVFVLLTSYYKLFHAFFKWSRHIPVTRDIPVYRDHKPGMKYVSGNRDVPVYRGHINRAYKRNSKEKNNNLYISAFSSLKSPTFCTKPRVALNGSRLFLRQRIICSFLGFIDNLNTLFYKRNKKKVSSVDYQVKTALGW